MLNRVGGQKVACKTEFFFILMNNFLKFASGRIFSLIFNHFLFLSYLTV